MNCFVKLAILLILCSLGCTDISVPISRGESSYQEALTAYDAKEFGDADKFFTDALEKGYLNVDLMCDARLKRAASRIELDDFEGAREDLEFLLEGAPSTVDVLISLGRLAIKEGNKDEAKHCFLNAKKQDPKIVIPADFQ